MSVPTEVRGQQRSTAPLASRGLGTWASASESRWCRLLNWMPASKQATRDVNNSRASVSGRHCVRSSAAVRLTHSRPVVSALQQRLESGNGWNRAPRAALACSFPCRRPNSPPTNRQPPPPYGRWATWTRSTGVRLRQHKHQSSCRIRVKGRVSHAMRVPGARCHRTSPKPRQARFGKGPESLCRQRSHSATM